jgi:hypothetical protein
MSDGKQKSQRIRWTQKVLRGMHSNMNRVCSGDLSLEGKIRVGKVAASTIPDYDGIEARQEKLRGIIVNGEAIG